ncbi:hypothetical protein TNCV_2184151 [Trichonephila clavipes]|nr:hypothetical protein TNCV_2184151 [Trichonephila clavipes]
MVRNVVNHLNPELGAHSILTLLVGRRAWDRIPEKACNAVWCKCVVLLRQGGTLNSRRTTCPLVRLVEGEESWLEIIAILTPKKPKRSFSRNRNEFVTAISYKRNALIT